MYFIDWAGPFLLGGYLKPCPKHPEISNEQKLSDALHRSLKIHLRRELEYDFIDASKKSLSSSSSKQLWDYIRNIKIFDKGYNENGLKIPQDSNPIHFHTYTKYLKDREHIGLVAQIEN